VAGVDLTIAGLDLPVAGSAEALMETKEPISGVPPEHEAEGKITVQYS
jgi:hypothetical protein